MLACLLHLHYAVFTLSGNENLSMLLKIQVMVFVRQHASILRIAINRYL